uniref:Ion-translocating oxidoreductase complex subunit D n=1 Tax=candidate division WOR-3 bacterium TaxID=2052148 RepID=A0A7V1EH42_UNCW3
MDDLFVVSSAPHIHSKLNLKKSIFIVILCLLPSLIAGVIYFGLYSLIVVVFSILSSTISEMFYEYLKNRKITFSNGSAILTGLLLGMSLPPMVPLWIPITGSAFAIIIVKQIFGGIGFNLLNPALAGRAFLTLTFPLIMSTSYQTPVYGVLSGIDVITQATPLTILKNPKYYGDANLIIEKFSSPDYLKILLFGKIGGAIGETCKILLLIGGISLLFLKIIDFRIVIGYLFSYLILNLFIPGGINPLFQLFSGGVLLTIFFMATDWVTTPITKNGRWIFGIGCGIFTVLLRRFSVYPEGITPSILLMNLLSPLIDKLTIKRRIECQKSNR